MFSLFIVLFYVFLTDTNTTYCFDTLDKKDEKYKRFEELLRRRTYIRFFLFFIGEKTASPFTFES